MRLKHLLAILAGAVTLAVLSLVFSRRILPIPVLAAVALGAGLIILSCYVRRGRAWIINTAFVIVAFSSAEIHIRLFQYPPMVQEGTITQISYFRPDAELGYAIIPNLGIVSSIRKTPEGRVLYDVRYTIDSHGLRKTTAPAGPPGAKPVFFFGDSLTFGEGVNDEDALPQIYSQLAGVPAVNFGVHGYGPHQFLRSLEINRPAAAYPGQPAAIVYSIIAAHMARAAGRAPWDQTGPHYEVRDGELEYLGPYKPSFLQRERGRFQVIDKLLPDEYTKPPSDADRMRTLAILLRARDLSASRLKAPLFVINWCVEGSPQADTACLDREFEQNGIRTLKVANIPGLMSDRFYIPIDHHPTGAAYRRVAEALRPLLNNAQDTLAPGAKLGN